MRKRHSIGSTQIAMRSCCILHHVKSNQFCLTVLNNNLSNNLSVAIKLTKVFLQWSRLGGHAGLLRIDLWFYLTVRHKDLL